jgi:hypothetical protein
MEWYANATGGAVLHTGSSYMPSITGSATYYAQAANTATGCVSASRTAVTATVYTVPTITRSGGAASQTVDQNKAITTITYTGNNAIGIALSDGGFPSGVSGTAGGNVFTISGTPSTPGTFTYALTAYSDYGCTSPDSTGTLMVNAVPPPPDAASTQTWTYGSLTWSDLLAATPSACTLTPSLSPSNPPPPEYLAINGAFYYNYSCLVASQTVLCPFPWRAPTKTDLDALFLHLSPATPPWPFDGFYDPDYSILEYLGTAGYIPSVTDYSINSLSHYALIWTTYPSITVGSMKKNWGMRIRCVR